MPTTCLYPGCSKPAFPGGQYCSRTHRDNASKSTPAGSKSCKFPGCNRPVYPASEFCSRTHRDTYAGATGNVAAGQKTCKFPACSKTVFPGSDFCGKTHRDTYGAVMGQKTCKFPSCQRAVFPGSEFCGMTHRDNYTGPATDSSNTGFIKLHEVNSSEKYFEITRDEFLEAWEDDNKPKPLVHKIFHLQHESGVSSDHLQRYNAYLAKHKNEKLLYHGTNRACLIGDDSSQVNPCFLQQCAVCSILRCAFDPMSTGANNRYGRGAYFSPVSSKADDYFQNLISNASLKCSIASNVALGNIEKLNVDRDSTITGPSSNIFDSIQGELVSDGGALNFLENVIYNKDAIRVSLLIMYE